MRGFELYNPPPLKSARVYSAQPYIPTLTLAKRLKRWRKISM
jgi:hypothetical protein